MNKWLLSLLLNAIFVSSTYALDLGKALEDAVKEKVQSNQTTNNTEHNETKKLQDNSSPSIHWKNPSKDEEIGILRRMVPHWLAAPELRSIVLGFEPASAIHGGDGALYVRIRRKRDRE